MTNGETAHADTPDLEEARKAVATAELAEAEAWERVTVSRAAQAAGEIPRNELLIAQRALADCQEEVEIHRLHYRTIERRSLIAAEHQEENR